MGTFSNTWGNSLGSQGANVNQDALPVLKYINRSGLDLLETVSNYNADILTETAEFTLGTSSISLPDLTGLNAVSAFSMYFVFNSASETLSDRTIFFRSNGSGTNYLSWLQIGLSQKTLKVDINGSNGGTSRYVFTNVILKDIKNELLITYDYSLGTNKCKITLNGNIINPSTSPATPPATTGTFTGASYIGQPSYAFLGSIAIFGVWNSVVSLTNARVGASNPLCYLASVYSGVDVSGNGMHATAFTSISKSYKKLSSWCMDYGFTYYSDGGSNYFESPYTSSGVPVITSATYVRSGVTHEKISEHAGSSTGINSRDAKINFDPLLSQGNAISLLYRTGSVFSATGKAGFYNSSFPHMFHISELNRETLTALMNIPHQFNIIPIFNGNSVNDRDYMTGLSVFTPSLKTNLSEVNRRLTASGDIGLVTVPSLFFGFENSAAIYTEDVDVDYEINTFPIVYQRDHKVLACKNGCIYLSQNDGVSWVMKYVPGLPSDMGDVAMAHIWGNGNIQFAGKKKMYLSQDNLATVIEKTVYLADGVTPMTVYDGQNFGEQVTKNPVYIGGVEMKVWNAYCNATSGKYCAVNTYYSVDGGETTKIAYTFGQNPNYGSLGDPLNPIIARHGHGVFYDSFNNKFWMATGDNAAGGVNECNLISGTYNDVTDTWTWGIDKFSSDTNGYYKIIGMYFDGVYAYFQMDSNGVVGLQRCLMSDIGTPANWTQVHNTALSMGILEGDVMILSEISGLTRIRTSKNKGVTWTIKSLANIPSGNGFYIFLGKNTDNWYAFALYNPTTDIATADQWKQRGVIKIKLK